MPQHPSEIARASATAGRALVLIDIDHFKRCNDTAGHAADNDILAGVPQKIGGYIRQAAMAWRSGDEEFMVILT